MFTGVLPVDQSSPYLENRGNVGIAHHATLHNFVAIRMPLRFQDGEEI